MAERLASGRHHLSRDEVAANQRQRLFKALVGVMSEKGYGGTAVDDLIRHAKVSRATFYEHFESKQDLFLAAFARMQRLIIDVILTAPPTGAPLERYSVMLDKYLGFIAADPQVARLYLVDVYSAGPEAIRLRIESQRDFATGVAAVFTARSKADRFACQAVVAAVATLVTNALTEGGAAEVLALKKPILVFTERALGVSAR